MINKKNLWFLTLFSLILVLSVYYITMPSELLLTNSSNYLKTEVKEKTEKTSVEVEESEVLTALRVTNDEKLEKEIDSLKEILSNKDTTVEQKNEAFEKMKTLNENKVLEKEIEKKIEETHKLKSFVKIENTDIKVTIDSKEHNKELANKIMRTVQENFTNKVNVIIEFKK
ncbi:MAG: SpoIIIAH-like family protein [Lactobacillales bacterium]|nr:SpoIIIAH-like family protein [Lactobacillales bacterium]